MKQLYVTIIENGCTRDLILSGISRCDIFVNSYETKHSIIEFGDQAAINLGNFVSYQFKETEKDCCSDNN